RSKSTRRSVTFLSPRGGPGPRLVSGLGRIAMDHGRWDEISGSSVQIIVDLFRYLGSWRNRRGAAGRRLRTVFDYCSFRPETTAMPKGRRRHPVEAPQLTIPVA